MSSLIELSSAFSTSHKDLIDAVFKLIGGSAAVSGAWLGLRKYWQDQAWQRKQFAYDYAERISKEAEVKVALRMLDWSIGFATEDEAKALGLEQLHWDAHSIAKALDIHDDREDGMFDEQESAIRNAFDILLERFDRLGDFFASGILKESDFPASLRYYVTVMNEDRLAPIRGKLSAYMLRYGFVKAHGLYRAFGARGF